MAFLFVINIIVVSLVVREVCGTTTKETHAKVTENSRELEVSRFTKLPESSLKSLASCSTPGLTPT